MQNICPGCGNEIDPGEARGLCSACLIREGIRVEPKEDPLRNALEEKFQGQYRMIRLVGKGGMGAVYLARDLALDREVAIKVVRTTSDGVALVERFRREARTAARLSHPNIVPLHAFGEIEGMPYFVMGYVRGESLADRLEREGRLPEEDARRILAEIADALDHAHRQGVVHRDVKPDNVLLDDETGRALLTDFGVATGIDRRESMTQTGSIIGTPHFMSPEQASGRIDIDGRSDIYSLGVMGYVMLSGRPPFDGSGMDVLTRHLNQSPIPVQTLVPGLSDATAHVIDRCLAKDREERWQDGRSLRLALGASEEAELPAALESAEGSGMLGLLLLIGILWFCAFVDTITDASRHPDWQEIYFPYWWYSIGPVIFIGSYVVVLGRLRREGLSISRSLRLMWREPRWWPTWYPRGLRRPGNVWDKLPATVRAHRLLPLVPLLCGTLLGFWGMTLGGSMVVGRHPFVLPIVLLGIMVPVVAWLLLGMSTRRELKRKGIADAELPRVMFSAPPSRRSFWRRPHIAEILAPEAKEESNGRADTPHDHMQSILRQADELTGALRPLGTQAAVAARRLVASIDEIDHQIAELARNIEPGEEERLSDKIESLAATSSSAEASAPLRSLLEQQLDLIRSLSDQIEEAKERRSRRIEMLRTLALHVASLRSRQSTTPSELRRISEEVRHLCEDIQQRALELAPTELQTDAEPSAPTVERL